MGGICPSWRRSSDGTFLSDYVLGKVIGQGAFGTVYMCLHRDQQEAFRAVKFIDHVEVQKEDIAHEIRMMQRLLHPCVLRLYDVYYENVLTSLVLEYYVGGDLIEALGRHWNMKGVVLLPVVQNLASMMLEGVEWLHQNQVVHRDLKGDNFLCSRKDISSPDCKVAIADFATASDCAPGERLIDRVGTVKYWAPEQRAGNYALLVDVWAVGVVVYSVAYSVFPLGTDNRDFTGTGTARLDFPSDRTSTLAKFLEGLLAPEEERLSASSALQSPFLTGDVTSLQGDDPMLKSSSTQFMLEDTPDRHTIAASIKRRRTLVTRLFAKAADKRRPSVILTPRQLLSGFEINYPEDLLISRRKFEWQFKEGDGPEHDVVQDASKLPPIYEGAAPTHHDVLRLLEEHGVVPNGNDDVLRLVAEVRRGKSRLMLDAAHHRKMVRVVEVICLRVWYGTGRQRRYLLRKVEHDDEEHEVTYQLLNTEKKPHENGVQAAKRALAMLNMQDCDIVFSPYYKECFQQAGHKFGLDTIARKEILDFGVTTTDAAKLQRIGLDPSDEATEGNLGSTMTLRWATEAECQTLGVLLRAPALNQVASLVEAPMVCYQHRCLERGYCPKEISQFCQDGAEGKSHLALLEDGSLVRVKCIVVLRLTNKDGQVLMEVGEADLEDEFTELNRMPGIHRIAHENLLWSAKRIIKEKLKMNENLVTIEYRNVEHHLDIDETSFSIPTYCAWCIVRAKVNEDSSDFVWRQEDAPVPIWKAVGELILGTRGSKKEQYDEMFGTTRSLA